VVHFLTFVVSHFLLFRILQTDPTWETLPENPSQGESAKPRKKSASEFEFAAWSAAWTAARAICDGIVQPEETRNVLARAVQVFFFCLIFLVLQMIFMLSIEGRAVSDF
jgi:hypothetical protein